MATGADSDAAAALLTGELKVHGKLVDSSNSALVVSAGEPLGESEHGLLAVYKPIAGERPLWDFPTGTLAHREVAAYELSAALGWDLVPLTVWREDAPAGPGMCQVWIDTADTSAFVSIFPAGSVPEGWHLILEGEGADGEALAVAHSDSLELRRMAVFDALANNADRKIGHILLDGDRLLGIDHGVSFNVDPKLRTVLWGFAGTPLDESLIADVSAFAADFEKRSAGLAPHLDEDELAMTFVRARELLAAGTFPAPHSDGPSIPWPII